MALMSQVRGAPTGNRGSERPCTGPPGRRAGGLQACTPALPLSRSKTTYLTRRQCRAGRAGRADRADSECTVTPPPGRSPV